MKSKQIILTTILILGQLMCFGQTDRIANKLEPNQLEFIHNTHQYVVQADGKLLEVDTITDKSLLIQNSYPKGGSYTNPEGERFGYGVFWTSIVNETDFPIQIAINFPADSFPILNEPFAPLRNLLTFSPDSITIFNKTTKYFKLFLPSDKVVVDKMPSFDYGATKLKYFLDNCLNESTSSEKMIQPKEAYFFFTGILIQAPDNGPVRTGIVAKDQQLFYRVSIDRQLDTVLIPCGRIAITKK